MSIIRVKTAAALVLCLLLVWVGLSGSSAAAATTSKTYPVPADGTFELLGHGWGHGIGMSQYGALGGANAGASQAQILSRYYPGATTASVGNPTIRVRVASLGSSIQVLPATGLRVTWDLAASSELPRTKNGQTVARWRIVPSTKVPGTPTKFRLEYLPVGSTTWLYYATAGVPLTGAFLNPTSGTVTTLRGSTEVVYRGQVRGTLIGSSGSESLTPVVALPLEDYLLSVVPSESPASWPAAALGAQAVAARSYAERYRRYSPISATWYDVYDDTRSQVFPGTRVGEVNKEFLGSTSAVRNSAGQALWYGGKVALTMFSSSSGGWTAAGGQPYLAPVRDDWDAVSANPNHTWTTSVSARSIQSSYSTIGTLRALVITSRSGLGAEGGRVVSMSIVGSSSSVTTTGAGFRSKLGLKSDWFTPGGGVDQSFPRDVTGDGKADLLAIESYSGALRVYPGNNRGGASSPVIDSSMKWASYPVALTAGTFDADALSDVLLIDTAGRLLLRPGQGAGTFGPPRVIGTGWGLADLVSPVGDFDGDRCADLMVRLKGSGALYLYRGDGTGGFKPRISIGAGWQGVDTIIGTGDFTGDGVNDILYTTSGGDLWLYPGNGDGGFQAQSRIGAGWGIYDTVLSPGDFTGNGKSDIIARNRHDNALYLYAGNGNGGAAPAVKIGAGWGIFSTILQ